MIDGPPPFNTPGDDEDASERERVYAAILHTRDPAPVSDIARRAGCSDDTARTHLDALHDDGIVDRHGDDPVTYARDTDSERDDRVDRLARQYPRAVLEDRATELRDRIDEYRNEYPVDDPSDIDTREHAGREDKVYIDACDWTTCEEQLRLHIRALSQLDDN